ncbi:MAG: DUF5723 family protein [Bacteroidia bacterium]
MKQYIFASFLSLMLSPLFAQQELGLHFMTNIWQSQETQPAYFTPKKVVIAFPSSYYNFSNSGFSLNKLFLKTNDSLSISPDNLLSNLKTENYLRGNLSVAPLALGLRFGNLQFGLSTAVKTSMYAAYSKDMVGLFLQGNGKYIGQTVNMGVDFAVSAYSEIGLSGAYRFLKNEKGEERLAVGAKIKYLNGLADFSVSPNHKEISLYTDPEFYAITLKTDYQIQSSMIAIGDSTDLAFSSNSIKSFSNNNGWGLDLGASFQITDKWNVSASVIDIGQIHWKENTKTFKSAGQYEYSGVTFNQLVKGGESVDFQALGDTLRETFQFKGAEAKNYTTSLPTKYYLSTTYKPLSFLRIGGLFYGESFHKKFNPALAISGNLEWEIGSIGLVASYRNGRIGNLGLNAALTWGWFQLFVASDHVIGLIAPDATRNANLRGGMNLAF